MLCRQQRARRTALSPWIRCRSRPQCRPCSALTATLVQDTLPVAPMLYTPSAATAPLLTAGKVSKLRQEGRSDSQGSLIAAWGQDASAAAAAEVRRTQGHTTLGEPFVPLGIDPAPCLYRRLQRPEVHHTLRKALSVRMPGTCRLHSLQQSCSAVPAAG